MAITKRWAGNGIKSPIPTDPQGDNLVNYDEGFTTPYRTPIKDGGEPIKLDTFNQLMFDITDEIIENKSTLNQLAQQITGLIDDTQTSLTTAWSSELVNSKLSTAAASVIDDNQTTGTLTWSSLKISAEIGQGGGGDASIDDNTIATDKVWSSFKTNEMVKGGRTIAVSNLETISKNEDAEIKNDSANAKMANLSVQVKTDKAQETGDNVYLGDVVVYYNDITNEVLRESCISQKVTGATPANGLTSAIGMTMIDAQDSLLVKAEPANGVTDFWQNVTIKGEIAQVTGSAPEPTPTGEGLTFIAEASNSSVLLQKVGTGDSLLLEYQTIISETTSNWQDYTLGTKIDLNPDDKVVFKNKTTQSLTQSASYYHQFVMTGEIKAEGDVAFLYNKDGVLNSVNDYGCFKLFANCASLNVMPDLSATTIGNYGYANMFEGCSKLKTIKSLNATTLSSYAYKEMFKNCSELIISETTGENEFLTMPAGSPSDAATDMFIGTKGRFLGTPTAGKNYFYNATLPATDMLRFTAKLDAQKLAFTKDGLAPKEPSINLEYNKNGEGWKPYAHGTIITCNAGEYVEFRNQGLQHPTFTQGCHTFFSGKDRDRSSNFKVSGNIMYIYDKTGEKKDVPNYGFANFFTMATYAQYFEFDNLQLPATILGDFCYFGMFGGLYTGNSFTNGKAPDLPATQLAQGCYLYMFKGRNVVIPPQLPATNLPAQCYAQMFEDCHQLFITEESGQNLFFSCPNVSQSIINAAATNMFSGIGASSTIAATPTAGQNYFYNN